MKEMNISKATIISLRHLVNEKNILIINTN